MNVRRLLLASFVSVVVLAAACSKKDGGASTTSTTSAAAVSGACAFVKDKARCQPAGKAAFCRLGDGKTEWQTFSCPDCKSDDKGVKCSSYKAGELCDFTAPSGCNADGKSSYQCDVQTKTWKISPCAGGCKEPAGGGGGFSCN